MQWVVTQMTKCSYNGMIKDVQCLAQIKFPIYLNVLGQKTIQLQHHGYCPSVGWFSGVHRYK